MVIIITFDIKDQLFLSNKNSILRHPLNNLISKRKQFFFTSYKPLSQVIG